MNAPLVRLPRIILPRLPNPEVVFLQSELEYFFAKAVIPIHFTDVTIDLLDYFPMLKQGYAIEATITQLMNKYARVHDLRRPPSIYTDELILTSFGGQIPAYYYSTTPGRMITMEDAVNQGRVEYRMNSFQLLGLVHPNPEDIPIHYFTDLIPKHNYINLEDIPELKGYIKNKEFRDALDDELMILEDLDLAETYLRDRFPIPRKDIGIAVIMSILVGDDYLNAPYLHMPGGQSDKRKFTLLRQLLADPKVITVNKLVFAVATNDPTLVDKYLYYDPRTNNYEAYHLAVQKNNPIIINKLKTDIARRNLLEQQVFKTMMVPVGPLDQAPYQGLYQYGQSLLNK
jgi:hypothetical protein